MYVCVCVCTQCSTRLFDWGNGRQLIIEKRAARCRTCQRLQMSTDQDGQPPGTGKFLRLCESWPIDSTKTGRDLGTYIRQKVAEGFKHGEASSVNERECDSAYESLMRINSNVHMKQFPRSVVNGCTGLTADECRTVVSTDGLAAIQEEDRSFLQKLRDRKNETEKET